MQQQCSFTTATVASAIHLSVDVVGLASRSMGQPGHDGGSAGSNAAAGPGGGVFPGLQTARVHALQLRGTATQAVKAATCDGQALSAISAGDEKGYTKPGWWVQDSETDAEPAVPFGSIIIVCAAMSPTKVLHKDVELV